MSPAYIKGRSPRLGARALTGADPGGSVPDIRAYVARYTTQSVASGANANTAFTTTQYNEGLDLSDTGRITIITPGLYIVSYGVVWDNPGAATGGFTADCAQNYIGSAPTQDSMYNTAPAINGRDVGLGRSAPYLFDVDDSIELATRNATSATQTLQWFWWQAVLLREMTF